MVVLWLKFLFCFLVIVIAGSYLTKLADTLAEKTGLGHTWIGVLLLATVTSLPETFTGVVAVTVADVPNITVGNLIGSCVFNLMLLGILDIFLRGPTIYVRAGGRQRLSALLSLTLILVGGIGLWLGQRMRLVAVAQVGVFSFVVIMLYLVFMRLIFTRERMAAKKTSEEESPLLYAHITLRRALAGFAIASAFVVAVAAWLPYLAKELAHAMSWSQSFVGSLFVAATTSTPELVVTIAIIRMGVVNLAFGNIFGSVLYNIAMLGVLDILYRRGPLLADVSSLHLVPAFGAALMTCIVIAGLEARPARRIAGLVSWPSLLLIVAFIANAVVLSLLQR